MQISQAFVLNENAAKHSHLQLDPCQSPRTTRKLHADNSGSHTDIWNSAQDRV